jgi:SAM-dependent methyltransferase
VVDPRDRRSEGVAQLSAYIDGAAWAGGPDRVYGLAAEAAIRVLPDDLSGVLAFDAGAGTGAATRALRRRGARTVSSDLSLGMLAAGPRPALVADVRHLPLRAGAVDLSVATMVLSHLSDPEAGLAELSRVTRPAGTVLASAFPAGARHPARQAAERVLAADGYRPPDWYVALKAAGETRVGTPEALRALGRAVGLVDVHIEELAVDLASLDVDALVGWRLGMAHVAPYLADLSPRHRDALARAVADAVRVSPAAPLGLLVLLARRG